MKLPNKYNLLILIDYKYCVTIYISTEETAIYHEINFYFLIINFHE